MAQGRIPGPLNVKPDLNNLQVISFNTSTNNPSYAEGKVFWDKDENTLALMSDQDGPILQIGQETWLRVINNSLADIPDGSVVYINGALNNRPSVALAMANSEATSMVVGITTQIITAGQEGYVTIHGVVHGFNTELISAGTILYLSDTVAGGITDVEPTVPNQKIKVGHTLNSQVDGSVFVSVELNTVKQTLPIRAGFNQSSVQDVVNNNDGTITVYSATCDFYNDLLTEIKCHIIEETNLDLSNNLDDTIYIYADRDTDQYGFTTDQTLIDDIQYIRFAQIYMTYTAPNYYIHLQLSPTYGYGGAELRGQRTYRTNRYAIESGLDDIAVDTSLNITSNGGIVWSGDQRYTILEISPATTLFFCYHVNSVWTIDTSIGPVINNSQYDDGVDLVTLSQNKMWTINYIYRGIEHQNHLYIVLSPEEYESEILAKGSGIIHIPPDIISSHAILIGRIIVKKNQTTGIIIESVVQSPIYTNAIPVNKHNDLSMIQGGDIDEYYHLTQAQHDIYGDFQIDINRFGFLPTPETSISFNGLTPYTFTIAPLDTEWTYYRAGIKCTITGSKTINLSDNPLVPPTTGMWFIYIDSTDGTLSKNLNPWSLDPLSTVVLVATIFYNDTLTPKFHMADERHTCSIDRQMHRYNHFTNGTKRISGGSVSGYTLTSDVNVNKVFGISEALIADEDIFLTLSALTKPNGTATNYTIFYRTAPTTWVWQKSSMPFYYVPGQFISWDNNGVMTQATGNSNANRRFVNSYLIFCDIVDNTGGSTGEGRFFIIPGRSGSYTTLALAQAESVTSFDFTGLNIQESVIMYRLTWDTGGNVTNYATSGKCVLAAIPQLINSSIIAATAVSPPSLNHNDLQGKQGGTTGEYYHLPAGVYNNAIDSIIPINTSLADLMYSGISIAIVYGESITEGDLLYLAADGTVMKADANAIGKYPVMGLALATASSGSNPVLIYGSYRNDTRYNFTIGGLVFLSVTAGGETQTAPTATDDVIQIVGIALTADIILFKPEYTYLTHT